MPAVAIPAALLLPCAASPHHLDFLSVLPQDHSPASKHNGMLSCWSHSARDCHMAGQEMVCGSCIHSDAVHVGARAASLQLL